MTKKRLTSFSLETCRLLADEGISKNYSYVKLTKVVDLLARPRGFEPLTLGLEMRWIGYTNDLVLHRFDILKRVYENGLKTRSPKLREWTEIGINFYFFK